MESVSDDQMMAAVILIAKQRCANSLTYSSFHTNTELEVLVWSSGFNSIVTMILLQKEVNFGEKFYTQRKQSCIQNNLEEMQ